MHLVLRLDVGVLEEVPLEAMVGVMLSWRAFLGLALVSVSVVALIQSMGWVNWDQGRFDKGSHGPQFFDIGSSTGGSTQRLEVISPSESKPLPEMTARQKEKYSNQDKVTCYHFDDLTTLERVKAKYHTLIIPKFIDDMINLRPSLDSIVLEKYPRSMVWSKEVDFILGINPLHLPIQELTGPMDRFKDRPSGLSLVGWYVHPNLTYGTSLFSYFMDTKLQTFLDFKPGEMKWQEVKYVPKTFSSLEDERASYLVSLLDLTHENIDYLTNAKGIIIDTLKVNYGVDLEKDQVALFFHFPYGEATASLHIHVRVNQPTSPLEKVKNFAFDEVVKGLESGKTISEIILDKQSRNNGCLYVITKSGFSFMEDVPGVTSRWVENPFPRRLIDLQ